MRMKYAGFDDRKEETVIRGEVYPSRVAAAKAHGVTASAVSHAASLGRLDLVGTRQKEEQK